MDKHREQKGSGVKSKKREKMGNGGSVRKEKMRRMGSSNLKMAKEVKRFYPIRKSGAPTTPKETVKVVEFIRRNESS